jgi:PKD repeat protein
VLVGGAIPTAAGAAPFGELSRFGSAGIGNGQFSEAGTETIAFGVDPTTESVYVGDKPSAKVFRVQKFSATGTFLGAATLKALPGEGSIEGVALDPVEKRFYVLLTLTRGESEFGEEEAAAAEVYAFSTEPTGGKLEPAPGTVEEGVLAGKPVLKPASNTAGQPLLEPSGITVDPTTHDIILMGLEERNVEEPRVALERISSSGALGERWVDSEGSPYFEVQNDAGSSPVVTSTGQVYVVGEALGKTGGQVEQIVEIPSSFGAHAAAKPYIEYEAGELDLVTFPGEPHPLAGGGLSLAPDGTLWVFAKILSPGIGRLPGALAFSTSGTPTVRGWTGGQTIKLGTGKCVISFTGHPMVAAGAEGVFIFDSDSVSPRVVRFGPGGEGCPTASASPLEAFVGAVKEEPSDLIAPGSEVKLSTTVAGANALKVKWSFGDGSGEALTSDQHQTPTALHKYTTEGEFKVIATIESDNLDTPTIVLERTLTVSKPLPIAKFTASTPVTAGQADTFDAKGSTGAEGAAVSEYKWSFGDGSPAVATATPTISHAFAAPGHFTVTLQVLDANKLTSKVASAVIAVNPVPVIPPPTTTGTTPPPPPPGETHVLSYQLSLPAGSLTASKSGALALKIDCAGQSSCTGTATLRTASAVSAGKHRKKAVMTLASGSFRVLGGHLQAIALHLSAAARTLLVHSGSRGLSVRVTVLAHDSAGGSHTTLKVLTIHAAKAKKHH